ncbi:hypothetical protein GCM10011533_11110 [Streptosporangium jomthongense]|uniref:Uncharacterized protein n=1 Tax=Marinobacter aromaticivorans TaxID=1494078 RepID=A0ABW2ITA2_9GAMM|nr:hypothetical protein [Marinobacter aromaticivorans]GGE60337.1 hypothetical protein GCM10011533_11110 [Streptosporangium jomthongense]
MADIHIEEFYKDAAVALVQLYGAFPRRVNLYVEDIAGPDEPDEFGLHSKRHMACLGALLWLAEEGFLRYVDTIRQEALDQAVLTQEAFIRLSAPAPDGLVEKLSGTVDTAGNPLPPSLQEDLSSHIHLVRTALKSRHSRHIGQVVRAALFQE